MASVCNKEIGGSYQAEWGLLSPTSASLPHLPAAENKFAKFLMTCLKCCFWCLEKFIRFLNRNAYIMVSKPGTRH